MASIDFWKDVEFEGRRFSIQKMEAQLSCYYAYRVMEERAPDDSENKANLKNMKPNRPIMSKKDFLEMQKDFLECVFEVLPAGKTCIINDDGNYAVEGLEYNGTLLQLLYISSFYHSLTGFFAESHLKTLAQSVTGLSLNDLSTSQSGGNSSSSP